jgi:ATP-dependent DNA ligase
MGASWCGLGPFVRQIIGKRAAIANLRGRAGVASDDMQDVSDPRALAAAWKLQRPGRRSPRDIRDAIVEPDWGGARVVAALNVDDAALYTNGGELPIPDQLRQALIDAFRAVDAVIEGHVTTEALRTGEGAFPAIPKIDRSAIILPRAIRAGVRDDPYVHARDFEAAVREAEPGVVAALEDGEQHAFVATDLLWLDGQPLFEVPLLERKRHLEAVLVESYLVRVTAFVRATSKLTLLAWGTLGFRELSWRAANGHYLPGEENPDWAVAPAPDASTARSAAPSGPR